MEKDVMGYASLISQARHQLVSQVPLGIEREMMGTHGGQIMREDAHINLRSVRRQPVGRKTESCIRVGRIARERVHVGGRGVDDARIRRGWGRHGKAGENNQPRIRIDVGRDGDFFLVITEAISAAHDKLVVKD